MQTDPSHLLYYQRIAREKKILKNTDFINAFGSPSQIKSKKKPSSSGKSSSIKSKSSSNILNSPGQQSSDYKNTLKTKTLLKIVSNNETYADKLVPNIQLLLKKYPHLKPLPTTLVDLPEALLRDIMIKANLQNEYVLRTWIKVEDLDVGALCLNPNAINFLTKLYKLPKEDYDKLSHRQKINWGNLCSNPNAIFLLKKRIEYEKTLTNTELANTMVGYRINWDLLSSNPNAIEILKHKIAEENSLGETVVDNLTNINKISWELLSKNPNAISLLKANQEKIVWNSFFDNKNLDIDLFEKLLLSIKAGKEIPKSFWNSMWSIPISKAIDLLYNLFPEKIDYFSLSKNNCTSAIKLLLSNKDKINYINLSSNTHNKAIKLLAANIMQIAWGKLAANTNKGSIKIIQDNIAKLNKYDVYDIWFNLSANPKAITLLAENPTKINIPYLCQNPNAVKLIKINKDKLTAYDYTLLSKNPCIFIEK
jgi:hypothetical protein